MGNISGKIWGVTQLMLHAPNLEVNRIDVKRGGYCSLHHHKTKFNAFVIESGRLKVEVHKDYGLIDVTILFSGDTLIVAPGEKHRFKAMTRVIAYEIYWSQMDPNDIVRHDSGGLKK